MNAHTIKAEQDALFAKCAEQRAKREAGLLKAPKPAKHAQHEQQQSAHDDKPKEAYMYAIRLRLTRKSTSAKTA